MFPVVNTQLKVFVEPADTRNRPLITLYLFICLINVHADSFFF